MGKSQQAPVYDDQRHDTLHIPTLVSFFQSVPQGPLFTNKGPSSVLGLLAPIKPLIEEPCSSHSFLCAAVLRALLALEQKR